MAHFLCNLRHNGGSRSKLLFFFLSSRITHLLYFPAHACNMPSHNHCFCNFYKGSCQLTRFKVNPDVKLYSLWDQEGRSERLSAAKQSTFRRTLERATMNKYHIKDMLIKESFDDCLPNYDGTDMVPQLSSIRDSPASPEVMQHTNLLCSL